MSLLMAFEKKDGSGSGYPVMPVMQDFEAMDVADGNSGEST